MSNISVEELEKIKQHYKTRDLQKIIDGEKNKKNGDGSDEENNDEDDKKDDNDQNFISTLSSSVFQDKRNSIYQKLKDELGNAAYKLHNSIKPTNKQIRSLDKEIGGLEQDQKAIDKKNNNDVDVWDNRDKEIVAQTKKGQNLKEKNNQSFIHIVKTRIFAGKGKKAHRHMGQVNLNKAADFDYKNTSFVDRISKLKEDRSHEKGKIVF